MSLRCVYSSREEVGGASFGETHVDLSVEENVSERLDFTQDGVYENNDRIVFDVLVHGLCAGSLRKGSQHVF